MVLRQGFLRGLDPDVVQVDIPTLAHRPNLDFGMEISRSDRLAEPLVNGNYCII